MYQALYRKYRPRAFDDVVGQEHITETLKNQIASSRLSHAYLFIGTRGTGKTTCAKILAKAVNCEHPENGNPCNKCPACLGIDDGTVMDVVEMDAASNNGVDNVRQLRDEAVFSPVAVKKRVYIIDEVHMLSTSAFNALLKILEEPPEHLMFILATTELHKVPATILSRCQRHSFKRLDTACIEKRLGYVAECENLDLTADAASLIARLSEGGMRDALSLLDQCSGRTKIDSAAVYSAMGLAGSHNTAKMLSLISAHDTAGALTLFQQLWQDGKDPSTLLGEISTLLRDILMKKVASKGGSELLSGSYGEEILTKFGSAFTPGVLINNIEIVQNALVRMKMGQAKSICELTLISLCEPDLGDDLPLLRERVAKLENAFKSGIPAATIPIHASAPAPVQAAEQMAEEMPFDPPQEDDIPPFDMAPPPEDDRPPFDMEPPPYYAEPDYEPVPPKDNTRPFEMPDEQFAPPAVQHEAVPTAPSPTPVGEWDKVRNALSSKLPVGLASIAADASQVSAVFGTDTLKLCVSSGFALNMLNRPDTLSKIADVAEEVCGKRYVVSISENNGEAMQAAQSDAASALDKLSQFDIVKFN